MKTNPNEPISPCTTDVANNYKDKTAAAMLPEYSKVTYPGLTIRQYYAGLAMQGYCANRSIGNDDVDTIATYSVEQADALIEALNENEG